MNDFASWVGLDLAARSDVTAIALVCAGRVYPLALPKPSNDAETRGRNEAGSGAAVASIPDESEAGNYQ